MGASKLPGGRAGGCCASPEDAAWARDHAMQFLHSGPPVYSLVCLRPESFGFLRQLQRLSLSPLSFWGLKAPVIHQSGMGQYLATPNTEKETLHGSHERLKYGISAQQGWRKNMVRQEHGDPGAGTL